MAPQVAPDPAEDADRTDLATAPSDPPAPARSAQQAPPPPDPSEFVVLTFASSGEDDATRLAQLAATGRAEPVQADAAPRPAAEGEGDVVLSALSTSSPRLWGVNLGRFGTRDAAERTLMRAALAELSSFEAGLRRVQSGQSGFEATFVGLTEAEARMACDRLHAHARDCATIAP